MNTKFTNQKDLKFGQILGIKVISTTVTSVLARVKDFISDNVKFYIVTPNPELILMAQDDMELKNALNSAELPIPDGVGLKLAIPDLNIIKGRELFTDLIKLAKENKWRVFLLGGLAEEASLTAKKLQMDDLVMSFPGPRLDKKGVPISSFDHKLEQEAVQMIRKFSPKLLFVAFGNPAQEIWIHKNLKDLNIGGAMAVGGTFRYVSGLSSLPPKWMEKTGLEWLWRLVTEPKRYKRIWNAVVVFPLTLLISKVKSS